MPGVRLFCAAPLPGDVNPGFFLPADPSGPLKACTCAAHTQPKGFHWRLLGKNQVVHIALGFPSTRSR